MLTGILFNQRAVDKLEVRLDAKIDKLESRLSSDITSLRADTKYDLTRMETKLDRLQADLNN